MRKFSFKLAAFAALLFWVPIGSTAAQAQVNENEFVRYGDYFPEANFPMTAVEKQLFGELKKHLELIRDKGSKNETFLPGLTSNSLLSVQISDTGSVLINLGEELNPKEEFIDDIPFFHELLITTQAATEALLKSSGIWNKISEPLVVVRFVFDGRTAFPGQYRMKQNLQSPAPLKKSDFKRLPNDLVVVSAGHGLFKLYDGNGVFLNWSFQRDPHNGVLEDENTPNFAMKLRGALVSRSQATVVYARDHGSTTVHPPTGEPWWKVSARYYLKRILPDRPDIWDTAVPHTDKSNADLERRDDIRSRPLYANYLGAQALFSLHSDGVSDSTKTGTGIWYNPNIASQIALATSVDCYVDEILKWHPNLAPWTVTPHPTTEKAELNLASMPTVIVEAGFHTNPRDAVFLLNPDYQRDIMRGVEKGWRLYTEGKPCTPLAIPGVLPGVTGPHNTAIPMPLPYAGYPRFPVRAEFRVYTACTAFDCFKKQIVSFPNQLPSPLPATFTCETANTTPTVTVDIEVQLIDADNIKTVIRKPYAECVKP